VAALARDRSPQCRVPGSRCQPGAFPAGEQTTVLAVAGVYRLPGQVGTGLDPDMVRCFAAVTIRSFIARLACALTYPAGTAVPADSRDRKKRTR
jgi:hypothetical protein